MLTTSVVTLKERERLSLGLNQGLKHVQHHREVERRLGSRAWITLFWQNTPLFSCFKIMPRQCSFRKGVFPSGALQGTHGTVVMRRISFISCFLVRNKNRIRGLLLPVEETTVLFPPLQKCNFKTH